MSTRIRISYEHPHELDTILDYLKPLVKECRVKTGTTPYRRAYLLMADDFEASAETKTDVCKSEQDMI